MSKPGNRGITFIELLVVFAIVALVIAIVDITCIGNLSEVQKKIVKDTTAIEIGLLQFEHSKRYLPSQATVGGFPAALNSIDPTIRANYKYACYNTGNKVIIRVPASLSSGETSRVSTFLVKSGLCSGAVVQVDKTIDCTLRSLNGTVNCK